MKPTITDELIQELGIASLPPEQQQDYVTSFYLAVRADYNAALMGRLTDEQLEAFQDLLEKQDDDATEAWLEQNLPDYAELYNQVVAERLEENRKMNA